MKKARKKPQKQEQEKEWKPKRIGVRDAVLKRWKQLQTGRVFDDRVSALCKQHDVNAYLPTGKPGVGVMTGEPWTMWEKMLYQEEIEAGRVISEGDRHEGEDYATRLSTVIATLKREFNLGREFDGLLCRYILWNDLNDAAVQCRIPILGSRVQTIRDHYGTPHVLVEVTPLTSVKDVERLWPAVKKALRTAYPTSTRLRATQDLDRLEFIVEKHEQECWSFSRIAHAWQEKTKTPTTKGAVISAYNRYRKSSVR